MRVAFVLLIVSTLLSACAPGLFSTKAPWAHDWERRANGSLIASDTPRNWQMYVEAVSRLVEKESSGLEFEPLSENYPKSWAEYWPWHFDYLHENQINAEKYIAYVVELRRKAGLPEVRQSLKELPAG